MVYKLILFSILLLTGLNLHAQQKLHGHFDPVDRQFITTDTGVMVAGPFISGYAPFMIKYKKIIGGYIGGRVGFIDTAGNVVIKPVYSECTYFNGNFAVVRDSTEKKTAMINKNGKIVIPFAIQYISKCENGLFLTLANRTISIRDSTNKVIVPYGLYTRHATPAQPKVWMEGNDEPHNNWRPPYFYVPVKFQKYLGVLKGGKWAVINNFGREIIQPKFDWIGTFTGNIAPIRIGTKYGVTNALGNNIVPPEYDDARILNQQFTQVELNKKCGVVSSDNKLVIALIYHDVTLINSNNFLVDTNGTYGVIDKNNSVIIPLKYSHIEGFGNGYIVTNKNDGTALFNALGKRLTNFVPGYSFQTGPVWTMREGGYVVYRKNTRDFNYYDELKDNLFYYRNKKWGVLGTTGAEITPPVYNIIDGPFAHVYIAHKEGKISLVNENGKFITNHIYDEAKYISGGKFKVRRGDKWGLIDFTGIVLYPCIYWDSQIWYDELQDKFIVIK